MKDTIKRGAEAKGDEFTAGISPDRGKTYAVAKPVAVVVPPLHPQHAALRRAMTRRR